MSILWVWRFSHSALSSNVGFQKLIGYMCSLPNYILCIGSLFFLPFFFLFSEAGDLLFMHLCKKGKQPVLEAITHRPKVSLIYIVYNTNMGSHFVLSLVCKSSWECTKLMVVWSLKLWSSNKKNISSIYFLCFCCSPDISHEPAHVC